MTDLNNVLVLYQEGNSARKIAKMIGVHHSTVLRYLRKKSIDIVASKLSCKTMVHDFFETIDSEEKAYFLGLLLTDGTVTKDKRSKNCQFKISLTSKDKDIIEKFKQHIKANTKIHVLKDIYYIFSITSNKMANDLAKYSIVPKKTFITFFPAIVKEQIKHFIRGVLDGDGCIYFNHSNYKTPVISFLGTIELLDGIYNFLTKTLRLQTTRHIRLTKNIYELRWYSKKDVGKILDYIYSDASIYIDRKFKKYLLFLTQRIN